MPDLTHFNMVKEMGNAKDKVNQALVVFATTAELAAIGNAINTTGKYQGKQVLNSNTGLLVVAATALAGGTWKNASTGVVAHTPV